MLKFPLTVSGMEDMRMFWILHKPWPTLKR